jgi:hypothetical protein
MTTKSIELRNYYKETGGPAGVAPAQWAQPTRPGSMLLTTACSAPAAHWPLEGQLRRLLPSRLKTRLPQGQGSLTLPPRNGSLRIHPSPGPSGRTVGTESLVLAGYLLPVGSPNTSEQHWYGRGSSGSCSASVQFDSPVVSPARSRYPVCMAPAPADSKTSCRAPVLTGPAPIQVCGAWAW